MAYTSGKLTSPWNWENWSIESQLFRSSRIVIHPFLHHSCCRPHSRAHFAAFFPDALHGAHSTALHGVTAVAQWNECKSPTRTSSNARLGRAASERKQCGWRDMCLCVCGGKKRTNRCIGNRQQQKQKLDGQFSEFLIFVKCIRRYREKDCFLAGGNAFRRRTDRLAGTAFANAFTENW